jgi:hypothetical protein
LLTALYTLFAATLDTRAAKQLGITDDAINAASSRKLNPISLDIAKTVTGGVHAYLANSQPKKVASAKHAAAPIPLEPAMGGEVWFGSALDALPAPGTKLSAGQQFFLVVGSPLKAGAPLIVATAFVLKEVRCFCYQGFPPDLPAPCPPPLPAQDSLLTKHTCLCLLSLMFGA